MTEGFFPAALAAISPTERPMCQFPGNITQTLIFLEDEGRDTSLTERAGVWGGVCGCGLVCVWVVCVLCWGGGGCGCVSVAVGMFVGVREREGGGGGRKRG